MASNIPPKNRDVNFHQNLPISNVQAPGSYAANPNLVNVPPRTKLRSGAQVPPLPPRTYQGAYAAAQHPTVLGTPYGGMYNAYSGMSGMFGGGYGRYPGSYGGGYGGGYGFPGGYSQFGEPNSSFAQLAEESSRPAFQSIESFVRTFGSVSVMLDSTLGAMYTSFRAVLGVAENVQRLRQMLGHVARYISAFALLRIIYQFYRRLLYMLGLVRSGPTREDIWRAASESVGAGGAAGSVVPSDGRLSSWPVITFFALLFGGPYMMYRLFGAPETEVQDNANWDPAVHGHEFVVAVHQFIAQSPNELSFAPSELLKVPKHDQLLPANGGWCQAMNRHGQMGYIPLNRVRYAQLKPKVDQKKVNATDAVPEASVDELRTKAPFQVDLTPPPVTPTDDADDIDPNSVDSD